MVANVHRIASIGNSLVAVFIGPVKCTPISSLKAIAVSTEANQESA
jgi:hypothetical protein